MYSLNKLRGSWDQKR